MKIKEISERLAKSNIAAAKLGVVSNAAELGFKYCTVLLAEKDATKVADFVANPVYRYGLINALIVGTELCQIKDDSKLVFCLKAALTSTAIELAHSGVDAASMAVKDGLDKLTLTDEDMDAIVNAAGMSTVVHSVSAPCKGKATGTPSKLSGFQKMNNAAKQKIDNSNSGTDAKIISTPKDSTVGKTVVTSSGEKVTEVMSGLRVKDGMVAASTKDNKAVKTGLKNGTTKCLVCGDAPTQTKGGKAPHNQLTTCRSYVKDDDKLINPNTGLPFAAYNGYGICDTCDSQLKKALRDISKAERAIEDFEKKYKDFNPEEVKDSIASLKSDMTSLEETMKSMASEEVKAVMEKQIQSISVKAEGLGKKLADYEKELGKLEVIIDESPAQNAQAPAAPAKSTGNKTTMKNPLDPKK